MRLGFAFAFLLSSVAQAQTSISQQVIAYFNLTDPQVTALAQAADDFTAYTRVKQGRVDELMSPSSLRGSPTPPTPRIWAVSTSNMS